MKFKYLIIAAAILAIAPVTAAQQVASGADPIINYSAADNAMNEAIAEARNQLDFFWGRQKAGARNETDFTLKVALPTTRPGGPTREHIWVDRITRSGDTFTAHLANEPGWLDGKRLGDRVTFTDDMISDWGFYRDDRMIGFYTIRVMLKDMPAKDAAEIRAALGENPK